MANQDLMRMTDLQVHFKVGGGFRKPTTVHAVDGVTLGIRRGEVLGLVGESGCGKSTLARAALRLREPTGGSIEFNGIDLLRLGGRNLRRMRRHMQLVFQDPYGSLDPRMTVEATLREPLEAHGIARGEDARKRVNELLALVGLSASFSRRYPFQFSGGQRQRIGIARALAVQPDLLICDEPISALDVSIRAQILNLLLRLRDELGLTYLFIAHDLAVVHHISDRVAVMYLGKIVEIGRPETIYRASGHPYTRALLSAIPVADPTIERARRRIILTGDVPSPVDPPSGCRFHPRCWLYKKLGEPQECRTKEPPLRRTGHEQASACHYSDELKLVERPRGTARHGPAEVAPDDLAQTPPSAKPDAQGWRTDV